MSAFKVEADTPSWAGTPTEVLATSTSAFGGRTDVDQGRRMRMPMAILAMSSR